MANINTRLDQTVPLTFEEMDVNLTNLNQDKLEAIIVDGVKEVSDTNPVVFQGNVAINQIFSLSENILSTNELNNLTINTVPFTEPTILPINNTVNITSNSYAITNTDEGKLLIIDSNASVVIGDTNSIPVGGEIEICFKSPGSLQSNNLFNNFNKIFSLSNNGYISKVLIQEDGKTIIVGNYTTFTVDGIVKQSVFRFNSDDTVDTGFSPNITSVNYQWQQNTLYVTSGEIQADGKIILCGVFNVPSNSNTNIVRLYSDGSIDNSFLTAVDGHIEDIKIQSDGKILIRGSFTTINGIAKSKIARLNTDGSVDTTFDVSVNSGPDSFEISPNGKIIICGYFTTVNGITKNYIARLNSDGSLDEGFIAPNFNNIIVSIALKSDNKIIIAGDFSSYSASVYDIVDEGLILTRGSWGALYNSEVETEYDYPNSPTGTEWNSIYTDPTNYGWTSLSNVTSRTYDTFVAALDYSVGNYAVSTELIMHDTINNRYYKFDITLWGNGAQGATFEYTRQEIDAISGNLIGTPVYKLKIATSIGYVAQLNENGSIDEGFSPPKFYYDGSNINVGNIVIDNDKILLLGDFNSVSGITRNSLVRLNSDGTVDTTFTIDTGPGYSYFSHLMKYDNTIILGVVLVPDFYNATLFRLQTNSTSLYNNNVVVPSGGLCKIRKISSTEWAIVSKNF